MNRDKRCPRDLRLERQRRTLSLLHLFEYWSFFSRYFSGSERQPKSGRLSLLFVKNKGVGRLGTEMVQHLPGKLVRICFKSWWNLCCSCCRPVRQTLNNRWVNNQWLMWQPLRQIFSVYRLFLSGVRGHHRRARRITRFCLQLCCFVVQ